MRILDKIQVCVCFLEENSCFFFVKGDLIGLKFEEIEGG